MLLKLKRVCRALFCLFLAFLFCFLISCNGKEENSKNEEKYKLVEMYNVLGKVDLEKTYDFYYLTFRNNGECFVHAKLVDNPEEEKVASYQKTDKMYIVFVDGFNLNYLIVDNGNKLELNFMANKLIFQLEK